MIEFEKKLRRALTLDLPHSRRPAPTGARPAAVLALFGEGERDTSILITRRTDTLGHHRGQMAFPGGARDPVLGGALETPEAAAIRETEEEVGIPSALVRVVGELPPLWTPSGFEIHPVAGILVRPLAAVDLNPNPEEIAEAFWVELAALPGGYSQETIDIGPMRYKSHVFQVGPHKIWGATAAILRNLLDRLEQVAAS